MINKVTLIGYAGMDAETRTLETRSTVGRFSLATSESYKDKDGNWQSKTEWHNVVLWGDLADRAASQVKKGSLVFVEGKIQTRKYNDKDGVERTAVDIVAGTFRLLEKRGEEAQPKQAQPPAQKEPDSFAPETADDLPF